MLRITKKELRKKLAINQYTYNEVSMGRKPVPHTWLNFLYVAYGVNTQWILHEEGKVLC